MTIDSNAPVIVSEKILINASLEDIWRIHTAIDQWPLWQHDIIAAQIDGSVAVGETFHWKTFGLSISSTIKEMEPQRRIVWGGSAQGIDAIHVWTMMSSPNGVVVQTEESWDGEPVRVKVEESRKSLEGSLQNWLRDLKRTAESAA